MRRTVGSALAGLMLGVSLSRIGFADWDEIQSMFTFGSPRLILAFGVAVVLLAPGWWLLGRITSAKWSRRRIHPGSIAGGAVFGAGWALCGACPSIVFVQLGEGQLGALVSTLGLFVGNWLYSLVHDRYFKWSATNCSDD